MSSLCDSVARATFTETGFLIVTTAVFLVGILVGWIVRHNWR